jgi:hypothetical protein
MLRIVLLTFATHPNLEEELVKRNSALHFGT